MNQRLNHPMTRSPDSVLDHAYAVILAGGSGTRFWPLSRRRHPKQVLEGLFGPGTLLERTAERIRPLIPPERTYVFTNTDLRDEIRRRLPEVPAEQVVRAVRGAVRDLIAGVTVFDRYEGGALAAGKVSLGIEVTFQPRDHTLTEPELVAASEKIVAAVAKATGATLR